MGQLSAGGLNIERLWPQQHVVSQRTALSARAPMKNVHLRRAQALPRRNATTVVKNQVENKKKTITATSALQQQVVSRKTETKKKQQKCVYKRAKVFASPSWYVHLAVEASAAYGCWLTILVPRMVPLMALTMALCQHVVVAGCKLVIGGAAATGGD